MMKIDLSANNSNSQENKNEEISISVISPDDDKTKSKNTWWKKFEKRKKKLLYGSWSWGEYLIIAGGILIGLLCPHVLIVIAVVIYLDETISQ